MTVRKFFDDVDMPDVTKILQTVGLLQTSEAQPVFIGEYEVASIVLSDEWTTKNLLLGVQYGLEVTVHFNLTTKLDADCKAAIKRAVHELLANKVWHFTAQDTHTHSEQFQLMLQLGTTGIYWTSLMSASDIDDEDENKDENKDEDSTDGSYMYINFLLQQI